MLFFTPFEKTIIKTRLKTTLAWIFLCLIYGYFFTVHWFFGFVFLLTIPLPIYLFFYKENLYYPSQSYFRIYFLNHSKEERLFFSQETELLGKYLFLGEMICLDDYVVLRKFGVVLSYHQIKHIFYEKCDNFCKETAFRGTDICIISQIDLIYHSVVSIWYLPFPKFS